jgi:peroxiredoxin
MIPRERSLVQKMQGKPFALIGINSDQTLDALKKALQKEHITWRQFYDHSTTGPIASQWHVDAWPTLYILDAKGVIRYKYRGGVDIDPAVQKLVDETNVVAETSTRPVN